DGRQIIAHACLLNVPPGDHSRLGVALRCHTAEIKNGGSCRCEDKENNRGLCWFHRFSPALQRPAQATYQRSCAPASSLQALVTRDSSTITTLTRGRI